MDYSVLMQVWRGPVLSEAEGARARDGKDQPRRPRAGAPALHNLIC
jgi:hypothetical protein